MISEATRDLGSYHKLLDVCRFQFFESCRRKTTFEFSMSEILGVAIVGGASSFASSIQMQIREIQATQPGQEADSLLGQFL